MAITLKRQLTEDEKKSVIEQHGRKCFATGHVIPEDDSVHFDHIIAFALGGLSEINNIAPMCPQHNLEKGTLSLSDFRTKLRIQEFFGKGDKLTLGHLLRYLHSKGAIPNYGLPVAVQEHNNSVRIESSKIFRDFAAYVCPITGWKYFYATLPVDLIDSDDDKDQKDGLQPRYLIFDKVFNLYRHFQRNPILQPSLGRIDENKIKLFDGQHKAAAILWNGHTDLECKIYIQPDIRLLNQTNISAHDKFAQTRFFSSIMVQKLGTQFGKEFEDYKNTEDGQTKSEAGFVSYLLLRDALTKSEVAARFNSFLFNAVLESQDNHLANLVAIGNRATDDKPITLNTLKRSLFSSFLHRVPVDEDMATDAYKRDVEVQNMVGLMNMFYDAALHRWNPKASSNDEGQRKLVRLVRSSFMKSWSELLKDAICAKLDIIDQDERAKPLYRSFGEDDLKRVRAVVERLIGWKIWSSPAGSDVDQIQRDNDKLVKKWLKNNGLTTGFLMGASE